MELSQGEITISVRDLAEARRFYKETLGCREIDVGPLPPRFRLYESVIVCVYSSELGTRGRVGARYSLVNAKYTAVPHQLLVDSDHRRLLHKKLIGQGVEYANSPAQYPMQDTQRGRRLALFDPSGNALEIRAIAASPYVIRQRERARRFLRGAAYIDFIALLAYAIWLSRNAADNDETGYMAGRRFRWP